MGWWPSIFGGNQADAVTKLDPKLREFLEKESPVKYSTGQHSKPAEPTPPPTTAAAAAAPTAKGSGQPEEPEEQPQERSTGEEKAEDDRGDARTMAV